MRSKHDPMLGLIVDLDLRVVRTHVALCTGGRQACEGNGAGVARMAGGAGPDGAVVVGLAHGMALLAARRHGRAALSMNKRMRRPLGAPWLVLLTESYLLRRQAFFAVDGSPRWSSVTAAEELLIDALVTAAAVSRREVLADDEAMVIDRLLAFGWLMAIEAVHAVLGMGAHLIFMHDRILKAGMTLGAFSAGSDEVRGRLLGFYARPGPINEESTKDKRKGNRNSDKDRAKRH